MRPQAGFKQIFQRDSAVAHEGRVLFKVGLWDTGHRGISMDLRDTSLHSAAVHRLFSAPWRPLSPLVPKRERERDSTLDGVCAVPASREGRGGTHTGARGATCTCTHAHRDTRGHRQMHRHMCSRVHIHGHTEIHIPICTRHTWTQTHAHMVTHRHMYPHAHRPTCTYIHMHRHAHMDTHTDTYTHVHTDPHAHTWTHTGTCGHIHTRTHRDT